MSAPSVDILKANGWDAAISVARGTALRKRV